MSKKNCYVLAGDYKDCWILSNGQYQGRKNIYHVATNPNATTHIKKQKYTSPSEFVEISKETIASWELMTEESQKSLSSSLMRGLVGGALLGPIGLIAGGVTGKNNKTYHIIVNWIDGKKSVFELADWWYKDFLKVMF